ncbi:hypothetical protein Q9S36_50015 [Microbacterium sp. ARD31]|uniref:hypothetical protein n=1 Tax=Microbacterium sp. ARD31 TaxID=2962576 RepID=UPI00288190F2|nr:hypothetical protein [Microbacterium sp. ARD31]MDT0188355.1 hypothetical protein [Microbacterium sp. ARD31]
MASALFALLAVVSSVVTDLNDRSYPVTLGATSILNLDFAPSGIADRDAFDRLAHLSDQHHLGLVRILPDLAGDADGQVFVPLGSRPSRLPAEVAWYGSQPTGVLAGPSAVDHSFATGQYLVTGRRDSLDQALGSLTSDGVRVQRVDKAPTQSASFLLRQDSFRTTLLAGLALMAAMALFWLSARAHGRALRVLGGVSSRRIHLEDLGRLGLTVALPALPVTVVAVAIVWWRHGRLWIGSYLSTLVQLEVAVVAVTLGGALAMSIASWPSTTMLATRQPAVRALRGSSGALKAVTFVLVVVTAGPAWWAYHEAKDSAAQEARWRALSDQVALRFPSGLGEDGFVRVTRQVGGVIADADRAGDVAVSYAMEPGQLGIQDDTYDAIVLVNGAWLRLMGVGEDDVRPVDGAVPDAVRAGLDPNMELWQRRTGEASSIWRSAELLTVRGAAVPLAGAGSGDLVFPERPLLIEVDDASSAFNDDFLASLSSSNNLVFDGLDATTARLREHGLGTTLQVKHAAEDGVLRAQFTAYEAWLRGAALVALAAAFVLALAISAMITALLQARRDFPLRLDGRSWGSILRQRIGREWAAGLVLGGVVVLSQGPTTLPPTAVVVALTIAAAVAAHVAAVRWTFRKVSQRTI